MNTWSQQEQELHESFVNRLYECKPVKRLTTFGLKIYDTKLVTFVEETLVLIQTCTLYKFSPFDFVIRDLHM